MLDFILLLYHFDHVSNECANDTVVHKIRDYDDSSHTHLLGVLLRLPLSLSS